MNTIISIEIDDNYVDLEKMVVVSNNGVDNRNFSFNNFHLDVVFVIVCYGDGKKTETVLLDIEIDFIPPCKEVDKVVFKPLEDYVGIEIENFLDKDSIVVLRVLKH